MGNATKTSTIATGSVIALFLGVGTLWQPPQETSVSCNDTTVTAAEAKTGSTINVPDEYKEPIKKAAQVAGLPESTVAAQIHAESNFDKNAGSPAGAQGPAQFLPSTFAKYSNGDIHNINDAMEAYGKYMADLKKSSNPTPKVTPTNSSPSPSLPTTLARATSSTTKTSLPFPKPKTTSKKSPPVRK